MRIGENYETKNYLYKEWKVHYKGVRLQYADS